MKIKAKSGFEQGYCFLDNMILLQLVEVYICRQASLHWNNLTINTYKGLVLQDTKGESQLAHGEASQPFEWFDQAAQLPRWTRPTKQPYTACAGLVRLLQAFSIFTDDDALEKRY